MRKMFVALLALALSPSVFAQVPKSDAGREGLKGKVRSVTTYTWTSCRNDQKEELLTSPIDSNSIIAGTPSPCGDGKSEKEPYWTEINKYDRQGSSTKSRTFSYKDLRSKTSFRVIDGDKTEKTEYFNIENIPPPPGYVPPEPRDSRYDYRYKYSYDGNKVETTRYSTYSDLPLRVVTTYNEKGNPVRHEESSTSNGKLWLYWTVSYDAQGNEAETTVHTEAGKHLGVVKYSDYEVDSRGNWVKRKVVERIEGKPTWTKYKSFSRTITYYDDPASKP